MDINGRIRYLREYLGLTMKDFGSKISLSQPSVSLVENGKGTVTERTIQLICATWNVNEEWLRNGRGGVFKPSADMDIEQTIQKHSFPDICAKLLYAFDTLDPDQKDAVLVYAHAFIATMVKDAPDIVAGVIAAPFKEETSRQALAKRLKEETSQSSTDGSTETA